MSLVVTYDVRQGRQGRNWITTKEVAVLLGISVYTIRSWRHRGVGPPVYRMNSAIRYDQDEVVAWHEACRLEGKAAGE